MMVRPLLDIEPNLVGGLRGDRLALRIRTVEREGATDRSVVLRLSGEMSRVTEGGLALSIGERTLSARFPLDEDEDGRVVNAWIGKHGVRESAVLWLRRHSGGIAIA